MGFAIKRPDTAFSNAPVGKQAKRKRQKNDAHLAAVRQLPCCICASRVNVEAAHLRLGNLALGKTDTGMGTKPDDAWVTPLCADHHRLLPNSQHSIGEINFWPSHNIDPFLLALALHRASGDIDIMEVIVREARNAR